MSRSALVCLNDAGTRLRKILEMRTGVITPAARSELELVADLIAAAGAALLVPARQAEAVDAAEDSYRRLVDVRKLARGPGLQTDFDGVLYALEEASDALNRPLYLPDE